MGHAVRRRLTIAILAVVVGTLVLSSAGSLFLVRRAAITTAESEITTQAQTIAAAVSNHTIGLKRTLTVFGRVGDYATLDVVGLNADGTFTTLPAPITSRLANSGALQNGNAVVGNLRNTVFALVPVALDASQRVQFGVSAGEVPVLVVTRHIKSPVNGLGYFLLVAAGAVVVAAGVAAFLARRISAPLVRAVAGTRRIAEGDLTAKVEVHPDDYPELAELAHSINAMGASLERSRGLERQFLLSVSHELRTPLTSIRGYADALSEGMADDVPAALGVISAEARRLERIVQDLLDLARLDARRFSLHPQRVDCADVVAGVADGFRPEAAALGLELAVHVEPGLSSGAGAGTWIDADPDRLAQIVANLVENASKFATSHIEVGTMPEPGGLVALWVADDGPGIRARGSPPRLRAPLHLRPGSLAPCRHRTGVGHRGRAGGSDGCRNRGRIPHRRRPRHPHDRQVPHRPRSGSRGVDMGRVIALAVASLALGLVCTPLARRLALRTGIVDRPGHLKRQAAPVPYLGGLAVFVAIVPGAVAGKGAILAPLAAATALGVLDDRYSLAPGIRLVGQCAVGIGIAAVLPTRVEGAPGWLLVVVATVILMNGVNLLDGLDALAAGVVAVAAGAFAVLLHGDGRDLAVSLAFALVAFLAYNRPPARIYLGDGGSYLLGASLAALLAFAWAPGVPPATSGAGICIIALPSVEVGLAVVRRLRARAPVSSGDRRHPYDLLVERGWSPTWASLGYVLTEASIVIVALCLAHTTVALVIGTTFAIAIMLIGFAGILGALGPATRDPGDHTRVLCAMQIVTPT